MPEIKPETALVVVTLRFLVIACDHGQGVQTFSPELGKTPKLVYPRIFNDSGVSCWPLLVGSRIGAMTLLIVNTCQISKV